MKFTTVAATALLASAAAAAPLTAKRSARMEARMQARRSERASKRGATNRKTNPPLEPGTNTTISFSNTTNVDYSANWAGAVLVGTGYTAVTGEFTVPTPSIPSGGSEDTEYCASAWVGIDGDTCQTAIIQTGVDFCVLGDETAYDAWYEWYPDYAYDFPDLTVTAGDVIKATVDATSLTGGTATLENLSTDETATYTFTNEGSVGDLCEYNAEWIVEDFDSGDSPVPFADFDTVTFSDATATDGSTTVGPEDATIIDIEIDTVLTSVSVTDDSVTVTYI